MPTYPAGRPTDANETPRGRNSRAGLVEPPHVSATMHTLREQHVPTAHTLPTGQSALVVQSARPAQGVWPSAQKPAPPVTEAHTHEPPGPQAVKVSHVWPVQEFNVQAPLVHTPESHCWWGVAVSVTEVRPWEC
jgi:hypothetical protein